MLSQSYSQMTPNTAPKTSKTLVVLIAVSLRILSVSANPRPNRPGPGFAEASQMRCGGGACVCVESGVHSWGPWGAPSIFPFGTLTVALAL